MDKCNSMGLLKSHGLKATKQRLLLLDAILDLTDKIFSVKKLFKRISGEMDQVTVYRILNSLNEKGIIREILTSNDERFFEISCIHNPVHPHFHCTLCKKISCLPALPEEEIDILKKDYSNNLISDISINFSGVCSECNK